MCIGLFTLFYWYIKGVKDLLSHISFSSEFHTDAPSNTKLFFILFVQGFGKQRELDIRPSS
jgi:hypothetical protein